MTPSKFIKKEFHEMKAFLGLPPIAVGLLILTLIFGVMLFAWYAHILPEWWQEALNNIFRGSP